MSNLSKTNFSTKSFSSNKDDIKECWDEFLSIRVKKTAVSNFLWEIINQSNGQILYTDFRLGTNIDRRLYSPIINGSCRPSHETLEKLSVSKIFTPIQRQVLLDFSNPERANTLITLILEQNFACTQTNEKLIRREIQNEALISSAELKKILRGALCGYRTVLKLCFGLHCSITQSEELLAAYGFCWQTNEKSLFLRHELSLKRFKAIDVLCDWETYTRKCAA